MSKKALDRLNDAQYMDKMGEALDQLIQEGKIPYEVVTGELSLDSFILEIYERAQDNYNDEEEWG